jgi:two-component system response regulator GlrR
MDLLENELFGHEAGAYTSANGSRVGVVQEADGGTLFLDEIDSLPLSAQVKLLRFLQEKTYRPLGASKLRKADLRIIAASNRDLEQLIGQGKFRPDLFYRLNLLSLHLPPLRQRAEDIPLLARHFLTKHAVELNRPVRDFTPAALRKLALYDWPGNIRELENLVARAMILCAGESIQSHEIDLPDCTEAPPEAGSFRQLKARVVSEFEQGFIRNLLARHNGNIAQAARAAQKSRRVFFQLMRKHNIRVERPNVGADGQPVVNLVIRMDKDIHPSIRP